MDINRVFDIVKKNYLDSCLNGISHVVIKCGALKELCTLIYKYTKIIFVTDTEMYKICGANIVNMLGNKLEKFLLYENQSAFKSDERSLEKLKFMLSDETELIIGAGGETIQNICKYESYESNLPYYMIAASPSSAKCISPESVLVKNNVRCVYPANTPRAIIADINIMKLIDYSKLKKDYEEMLDLFYKIKERFDQNSNDIKYPERVVNTFYNLEGMFSNIKSGLQKQELKAVEKLTKVLLILEAVNYDLKRIK